jgi:radical SAM protein with 4Fe4S-binding SPASM domain
MEADPKPLHARKPDLHDRRGGVHLLVWGELPDWMAVDGELHAFLGLFDGKRGLEAVLDAHAASGGDRAQAARVAEELRRRGILAEDLAQPPPREEPPRIANVTFNLTNRCNLRCPWCYNAGRKTAELAVGEAARALREARGILDPHASLIVLGGEPFLDLPRLLALLDGTRGLFGSPVSVSTNGTLLTPRAVREIASRGAEVQVSLDAPDPQRHDAIRGEGVFEKAVAGVRRLADAGVHTILSMVFTRGSEGEFEPYLDLAKRLGAAEARFIPLRRIGGGAKDASLSPDRVHGLESLLEVLARRPELRPLLLRDFFTIAMTVLRFSAPRRNCGIGRKVVFLDADGGVYPCPNHVSPEFLCGNVRERPLQELFLSCAAMDGVRARYDVSNYAKCRDCAFRQWCAGDCRGEVRALTGDPLEAPPHCGELFEMHKRMLWLLAENDDRLGTRPSLPGGRRASDAFEG